MIGQTLSHFKITAKLGEGGMGEVYRAVDTTLDREVALKVLPQALAEDPDRLARFEREAKTLAALDHPNIVHIYSVESATLDDDGAPQTVRFLTMQLVEGQQLSELITADGLSLERIFELSIPLAEALAAAHERGVVHRDLKPANIMVTEEGRVKVLDFGLAKLQQIGGAIETTEAPTEVLTGEGKILGTMPYMSPEQLEGKDLDSRSDIFSLGILLYEMATGRRPFQGDTSVSLISSIVKDTPPSVDTVRSELPHHLARIVNRCLDKDPKRRYQTATDVSTELDVLRREVESGIVSSGVRQPTSAEIEAARPAASTSPPTSGVVPSEATGRRWWPVAAAAAIILIAALAFWFSRSGDSGTEAKSTTAGSTESGSSADETSATSSTADQIPAIVVLPFQNRGDSEDEYFADGMSEEITTRLAGIDGLRVISSTSAMQYKDNRPPLGQIAEELDVDYVLDGSVRWAKSDDGSRVRITPQLVRTADDSQVWAESYDRVMEDVFDMQAEIAGEVVTQLGINLLEHQRQELDARPTDNLEAYQAYLRGNHGQYSSDFTETTRLQIIEDYQTAVALDPDFTEAWAALSHAHSFYYRLGYDLTEERGEMARLAYDRALGLDSDSPHTLFETGYYHYYIEQDLDAALEKFLAASAAEPDNAEFVSAAAYIYRRQGKFAEGLERLERALELSPRWGQVPAHIGEFAQQNREYARSTDAYDRAIAVSPDQDFSYLQKAYGLVLWQGDLEEAQRVIESAPGAGDDSRQYVGNQLELYLVAGEFDSALDLLNRAEFDWYIHQTVSVPKSLIAAEAHQMKGNGQEARAHFETARAVLEEALAERPNDYRLHASLGKALAGLGRKEEAIAAGKRAIELMPIEKDFYIGPQYILDLARTYTLLGMRDEALEQIDLLLSIPAKFSVELLKISPRWDSLRDHPRYQEIVEKYS